MATPDELPLYDDAALYDAQRMPTGDLAFYRALAAEAGGSVLELGCGTGRLTIPLAAAGIPITGLDRSEAMLAAARSKALGLPADVRPHLVAGDMTAFDLGARFPLVIITFNALQHLYSAESVQAALACVRNHLLPGGLLAFDVMNPDLALLGQEADEPYLINRFVHPTSGRAMEAWERLHYDRASQVCRVELSYRDGESGETTELVQHLRLFFPQELDLLLTCSGWHIGRKFGDFRATPFGSGSPKQIVVCSPA